MGSGDTAVLILIAGYGGVIGSILLAIARLNKIDDRLIEIRDELRSAKDHTGESK